MGTWRNLGKVNRKGVRKHRMAGPQPPIALPGWRAKKRRSAPPVGTVKSNAVSFTFTLLLWLARVEIIFHTLIPNLFSQNLLRVCISRFRLHSFSINLLRLYLAWLQPFYVLQLWFQKSLVLFSYSDFDSIQQKFTKTLFSFTPVFMFP